MLSIEQCRMLIGETEKNYSDEEIMMIGDQLQALAEICLDHISETRNTETEEGVTQSN